jgi:hypothetical protein
MVGALSSPTISGQRYTTPPTHEQWPKDWSLMYAAKCGWDSERASTLSSVRGVPALLFEQGYAIDRVELQVRGEAARGEIISIVIIRNTNNST